MPTRQARNCPVGDILLYKNEESRIITDIDHGGKAYPLRTYDALDQVNVWGTQEALF